MNLFIPPPEIYNKVVIPFADFVRGDFPDGKNAYKIKSKFIPKTRRPEHNMKNMWIILIMKRVKRRHG